LPIIAKGLFSFRFWLNTYCRQAFSVVGPPVFKSVPDFIRDPTVLADCFRTYLKHIRSLDTSDDGAI